MKRVIKHIPLLILIALLTFCHGFMFAQDDSTQRPTIPDHGSLTDAWAVFQGAKMRYIRDNMDLTDEEKNGFWPLYHEYEREKKEIMSNIIHGGPGKGPRHIEKLSNEEVDSLIIKKFKEEQDLLNLKIKYYDKLKEVMPVKKVGYYFKLDEDFRRHLIDRMRGKGGRDGRDGRGHNRD